MESWNNMAQLLRHVGQSYSNPRALNYHENGHWHAVSTEEVLRDVKYIALGLISLGLKPGDCVGLMALPSPRWTIVNMAIIMAGGVLVPLFPNISEENFVFQVTQTNIKIIFVERREPSLLFDRHRHLFETVIEVAPENQDETALSYEQLTRSGEALNKEKPDLYAKLEDAVQNDTLAAIIYTSATTGLPKGVELTHRNLTRHLFDIPIPLKPYETRYLSILPLAHIFGYSLNLITFAFGCCTYYFNDLKQLGVICREVHPTVLVVVPRLLERVYAKMLSAVEGAGFMKRHVGQWAFDMANDETQSLYKNLMHPIADKIVYSHLRDNLGGSVEFVISGGAALNPHLNHFFNDIGIPIYEGWGLTEACPITVNRIDSNKIGTVGKPFKGVELKISPSGEVLVRGSLTMRGYYKNPEATSRTLDAEGWLHTGDRGTLDSEGFLTLQGRLKEMYKTSTGEWVSPVPIEQKILKAPLIEMAMVIAEGRKYASCLLFPNKEVLDSLKMAHNATNLSDEEFLNSEFVRKEMDKLFESLNKHLNHWEQIHAYCFIPHPPSIEAGEITPSMKLRREVVMKKYQHLINAMYPEEAIV